MSQPPARCKDAVRRLWDYLDDGLDAPEREELEQHLTFCLRCCGELAFSRELRGLLRTKTTTGMPDPARHRLESFIERLDDDTGGGQRG